MFEPVEFNPVVFTTPTFKSSSSILNYQQGEFAPAVAVFLIFQDEIRYWTYRFVHPPDFTDGIVEDVSNKSRVKVKLRSGEIIYADGRATSNLFVHDWVLLLVLHTNSQDYYIIAGIRRIRESTDGSMRFYKI